MWFQPQCYITEHSSVTLNHTMVQIIDITRTTRILNKRTLFSTLATFSKLRNIILSPWVSPSILHIFSRLNFFQLDFIFFKNIFYHFQPFSTFHSQRKTYHNTKSSLTASPHNPRLGILPFLSPFCVSIVLKELTFFPEGELCNHLCYASHLLPSLETLEKLHFVLDLQIISLH